MADDDALHRCVTKFMFDTCRYTTHSCNLSAFFLRSNVMEACTDVSETVATGSSAEFYIRPILTCVGDIDIMQCLNNALAIPAQYAPPIELPENFDRIVTLYEIKDSHKLGFVYLKPSYKLTKSDEDCYAVETMENVHSPLFPIPDSQHWTNVASTELLQSYLRHWLKQDIPENHNLRLYSYAAQQHGPAVRETIHHGTDRLVLENDFVACIRCPVWPPLAADWPTRSRNHHWPNQTTINICVSSGCDVVGAVHPTCRQDEWMNTHQWRMSFSRAEVTLLNSWTPVQQMIYHMLRFVIKHEVLSKTNDNDPDLPTLCNYHIKTLMLWTCEKKPQSWWSAETSLIKLCRSLLHKLGNWVERKSCKHYFISNCNLIDHFVDASLTICSDLRCLADSSVLLIWFVKNYIRKCAQCCPGNVSALFEDTLRLWECKEKHQSWWSRISFSLRSIRNWITGRSAGVLERAIQAVVDWKLDTLPREIYKESSYLSEKMVLIDLIIYPVDLKRTPMIMKQLHNFNPNVLEFYTAAASLQVAYTVSIHSLTENFLEMLWMLSDLDTATVNDGASSRLDYGARLSIAKAIKLARLSNVHSSALEMLHNEMAKAYLHCCFAYGQESTYYVAHVLLAALDCKSGYYQAAIDHCKQVMKSSDHLRIIGVDHLPQIYEAVEAVFDLVTLYLDVHRSALNSDSKLEPDRIRPPEFTAKLLLFSDILLFRAMEMRRNECTETPVVEDVSHDAGDDALSFMDSTLFVTTLEQVALEKLIKVRQVMVRELQFEQFPAANEFEVLYAYKRGLFDECMDLCRKYIRQMFDVNYLVQGYLVAFPEMLSLLDGELVSVFGIIQLLHPKSFIDFPDYFLNMMTLLLYMIVQCHKNRCSGSPDHTMNLIRFVHSEIIPAGFVLDRMILKLTYRSLELYLNIETDLPSR